MPIKTALQFAIEESDRKLALEREARILAWNISGIDDNSYLAAYERIAREQREEAKREKPN